ncbi:MAG: hypothetical protein CM1200mP14_24740 [Gammaproteobacteria bacterium]|nr:MAG: hypothetical protein CM1200mP14_24740 [Gammaproteobacteria bacterium]
MRVVVTERLKSFSVSPIRPRKDRKDSDYHEGLEQPLGDTEPTTLVGFDVPLPQLFHRRD